MTGRVREPARVRAVYLRRAAAAIAPEHFALVDCGEWELGHELRELARRMTERADEIDPLYVIPDYDVSG